MKSKQLSVLVIGSGIAGLSSAIYAWKKGHRVTLVTKTEDPNDSNSGWAQGGIVYRGEDDSPELLSKDIQTAADKLALPEAVKMLAEEGPEILEELLLEWAKVPFEQKDGHYLLTEEAAHSSKRILFASDQTGKAIINSLIAFVKQKTTIKLLSGELVVDLLTMPHHSVNPLAVYAQSFCLGAYLYSIKEKKVRKEFADRVILAAGGIGQIYRYTTNPPVATGDGIALAWRAGCRIVNMEYTQFHPTTLAIKGAHNFLISEALRGEGGVLVNHEGKDFTRSYDPRGSLASRDRVSRAIMSELEKSGREYVYLDLSKLKPAEIRHRFPNIYRRCLEYKIDITSEPIPVRPAFHFSCGGVLTDLAGRTTLPNLYAVGETACTGVHGANRLASTSLLEGMVFGKKVAEDLERSDFRFEKYSKEIRSWEDEAVLLRHDPVLLRQDWETLQSTMWNYVGIIRMPGRMNRAGETLRDLKNQVDHFYWNVRLSREMVELRNAIQTALIITNSALKNKKSSGCHFITDDHD